MKMTEELKRSKLFYALGVHAAYMTLGKMQKKLRRLCESPSR